MSIAGSLEAVAIKAKTMTGILEVYTATGAGISTQSRPIPHNFDDASCVGTVWLGPGQVIAGNAQSLTFIARLDIWARSMDAGYAFNLLAPFPDRALAAFKLDTNLQDQAVRALFVGWDEPYGDQDKGGQACLVLPIRIECLLMDYTTTYTD